MSTILKGHENQLILRCIDWLLNELQNKNVSCIKDEEKERYSNNSIHVPYTINALFIRIKFDLIFLESCWTNVKWKTSFNLFIQNVIVFCSSCHHQWTLNHWQQPPQ